MAARKTSFYYAFLVLPADQRRAIIAVWDFCRAVDDAVDEEDPSAAMSPTEAVQHWRVELARCFTGAPPVTRQGRAPAAFCEGVQPSETGVRGCHRRRRDGSRSQPLRNLRRPAAVLSPRGVGGRDDLHPHLSLPEPAASDYALHLGVALQLTNIIRDVKPDLERGRLYLPLEDLRAAGCSVEELAAGRVTPIRPCAARVRVRARPPVLRESGVGTTCRGSPSSRRGGDHAGRLRGNPRRIEGRGYDVFESRVRVPKPIQALIALRQWLFQR